MSDANRQSDIEATVEDAIGMNFRSLKTLRDLFLKPKTVFEAYANRDRTTYTPALRLWLGLLGIQVILGIFFGGWSGIMQRSFEAGDPATAAAIQELTSGRADEFYELYGNAIAFSQPIVIGLFSALSVFVLGWFKRGLAFTSRLNIAMAVLSAGSVIGLPSTLMFVIENPPIWMFFASTALVLLGYFVTFGRGARGVLADTVTGAWLKAGVFSIILILLVIIGYMVISVGATVWVMAQLGPPPA